MKTEAGVRSVVLGGQPTIGPMQAIGGTRGSNVLTYSDMDIFSSHIRKYSDKIDVVGLSQADVNALPPELAKIPYPPQNNGSFRFNSRDQVRMNSNIALQFIYQAANCRLFYTAGMLKDMSVAWRMASKAMWDDSSLCVEDSTGHPSSGKQIMTEDPFKISPSTMPTATNAAGTIATGGVGRMRVPVGVMESVGLVAAAILLHN